MRRYRMWSALLVVALLATPSLAAPVKAPQYSIDPSTYTPGTWGVRLIDDAMSVHDATSHMQVMKGIVNGLPESEICTRLGTAPCDGSGSNAVQGSLVLGVCASASDGPCIESVSIGTQAGEARVMSPATLMESIDAETFEAQPEYGLPKGGAISLWKAADAAPGIDGYAVAVVLPFILPPGSKQIVYTDFRARVQAYATKTGSTYSAPSRSMGSVDGVNVIMTRGSDPSCAFTASGRCGDPKPFADDAVVGISLRLPVTLTGWLRGRLRAPQVSITPISATLNRMEVTARPVLVPQFYAEAPVATATPAVRSIVPQQPSYANGGFYETRIDSMGFAFNILDVFRSYAQDKAAGTIDTWALTSVGTGRGSLCLSSTKQLVGIVTTDAMVFDGTAPTFTDGSLNYRVAGMHYATDGSVQQGTYDLVMRSDAARCLYGFTSAPLQATISVITEGGEQIVGVQSTKEAGGWLYLGASGITFSSPTLRVKLTQATAPSPSPSPTPTSTPGAAPTKVATKTVTCVKAKQAKKFTGSKCPSGWKRK